MKHHNNGAPCDFIYRYIFELELVFVFSWYLYQYLLMLLTSSKWMLMTSSIHFVPHSSRYYYEKILRSPFSLWKSSLYQIFLVWSISQTKNKFWIFTKIGFLIINFSSVWFISFFIFLKFVSFYWKIAFQFPISLAEFWLILPFMKVTVYNLWWQFPLGRSYKIVF